LANTKSAEKRARQNAKARLRNKIVKTRVKTLVKETRLAASRGVPETAQSTLKKATQAIDKAKSRGAIHRKTAARKISRLTRLVSKTQTPSPA
jgi:small subunit ribosomal protein S20